METVYYIKLNNKGLKQNLAIHIYKIQHRLGFQTQFCRIDIFKKSVYNLGTKLYNKLPNYVKNLENLKLFKKQLRIFLVQQTSYSVDEYRVIHKSLWDFRTRLRNNQDRHGRKEHINR